MYKKLIKNKEQPQTLSCRGFTLLEFFLSIVLVTVLAGFGTTIFIRFQTRSDLDSAAVAVAHGLRTAQLRAAAVEQDSKWGVYVQTGFITVFQGVSYGSRDAAYDLLFEISSSITFSGLQEVVFAKMRGEPEQTGSITLANFNNETRIITINNAGAVSF